MITEFSKRLPVTLCGHPVRTDTPYMYTPYMYKNVNNENTNSKTNQFWIRCPSHLTHTRPFWLHYSLINTKGEKMEIGKKFILSFFFPSWCATKRRPKTEVKCGFAICARELKTEANRRLSRHPKSILRVNRAFNFCHTCVIKICENFLSPYSPLWNWFELVPEIGNKKSN